jgi:hypothetical protein
VPTLAIWGERDSYLGSELAEPVWRYSKEERNAPEHEYSDERHGELRAAITAELRSLIRRAYEPSSVAQ